MAEFTIEIATHTARVLSLFDSTRDYCNRYLTEKPAQFHITVTHFFGLNHDTNLSARLNCIGFFNAGK